jgi:hypothetical protein
MYIFKLNIGMPLGYKVLAASKASVVENLDRNYENRNICILSKLCAITGSPQNWCGTATSSSCRVLNITEHN